MWPDVRGGNSFLGFSWEDFQAYRDDPGPLVDLAAFSGLRLTLGDPGEGEGVVGQLVSPGYLPMLGLGASAGRIAFAEGASFGEPPTAVLAWAFWQRAFGGDPGVIGSTIRLDGHPVTVIGVGPEGFSGHFIGFPTDVWLPLAAADPFLEGFDPSDPTQKPLEMIGRLRSGTSPEAARAALNAVAERLEARHPDANRGRRVGVTRTTGLDHGLQGAVRAFVAILTVVSSLVLLIACLNVGSVLLVRAMSREREMAVRLAIGAGRAHLVRQILTETSLLVALGLGLGVAVAMRLNGLLADLVRNATGGLGLELEVDGRVLALTGGAALAAALMASAAPALHLLGRNPAGALRARGGGSTGRGRLRASLVVAQVAVSVVLVLATGLFVRALVAGATVDPGFDADHLASFTLFVDPDGFDDATREAVQRDVLAGVAGLPGVQAATIADGPVIGQARTPLAVEIAGVLPPTGQDDLVVDARRVGAGYLGALGTPLLAGRDFDDGDAREGPPVAVVNAAFTRRFWPGEDGVGRVFRAGGQDVRVVGVAADARYLVQDDTPDPFVYLSWGGPRPARATVTVRAAHPLELSGGIRRVVAVAVPGHRAVDVRTARQALRSGLFPQRMGALIVGAMGLTALLLATVGLYGLIQFTVTRDTHELGVRLALGGSGSDVLAVVLRKGLLLVALGTAVGVAVALVAAPNLGAFLGGVSPKDPLTYAVVILSFGAVALLACWLPARRAARISPTEALRGE